MAEDERAINTKKEQFHVQMCNRVNELDASVQADRENLLTWIKNDSENFTRLKYPSRQYFPEICKIFVCSRLTKTDDSSGKNRFCYSLDFHPCIKLEYTTYKSEEIEYYDTELGIVTYLESQFAIVFKIMDCLKLLKALDINAADISIGCVYEKLRTIALQAWREVVMGIVENDKIGFYHFAQNFSVIGAKFATVINAKLEAYGVTASDITISKMTIPESVREQIRQHSYENKCENDRYTAEVKFAGMYLEHYRKKAEIQSTYGTAETLTEFEKDRSYEKSKAFQVALNRSISMIPTYLMALAAYPMLILLNVALYAISFFMSGLAMEISRIVPLFIIAAMEVIMSTNKLNSLYNPNL